VIGQLGSPLPVVAAWAGSPINAALLLALIVMTFQHTALGLQVIYEDYIHTKALREAVVLLTNGACLLLGLMASVAVLKLAVAAH
jgi:succinate dehydrogenase / fumarate reductase membrane anchor subunit